MLAIDAVTAKGIALAGIFFSGDSLKDDIAGAPNPDELEQPLLLRLLKSTKPPTNIAQPTGQNCSCTTSPLIARPQYLEQN